MTGVLIRRRGETRRTRMMEAETRVMCLQAEEGQDVLATPKAKRGREQTPLTTLRRNPSCQHLDLGLLVSRL